MKRTRRVTSAAAPAVPAVTPAPEASGVGREAALAFAAALDAALGPLQRALETLLAVAGGTGDSATEAARHLGLEQTLAWRAWRVAHARSSAEAARFVVGPAALEALLAAARRGGAEAALCDVVLAAYREYRAFVGRCAGDDATLRIMVGTAEDCWADAANSRLMFNANRLRLGVQAASQLRCCVLYASNLEGIASAAIVDAFGELWWLRAEAEAVLRVARLFHTHAPAEPGAPVLHLATPLDPAVAAEQAPGAELVLPALPAFSVGSATTVHTQRVAGSLTYSIRPRAVGRDHASTLCFGEIQHDCFLPLATDPQTIFSTATRVPVETLVAEVYVQRELVQQGFVFRPLITEMLFRPAETALWAPRVDLAALGGTFVAIDPTGAIDSPLRTPRYRELVEYVFQRIAQPRPDFYCYRLRLPTPPLGLMISLIAGEDPELPAD